MSVELHILSGARAGRRARFDAPPISIGRHPDSHLQLDPERDLDVSARHAEIVQRDGAWLLRDVGSRNGTFVNGERLTGERALRGGEEISLGEHGPRVAVALATAPPPPEPEPARPAHRAPPTPSVAPRPASLAPAFVAAGALLVIAGIAAAYWLGGRESRAREAQIEALARANDSLARTYAQRVATLAGRVEGLDSSLTASKAATDTLRGSLAAARPGARADSIASTLRALESRRHAMLSAAQVDYSSIAARNGPAVTLIAVEWSDGTMFSGSGFCVRADGTIITNRHLVSRPAGETPTRIAVIFSDTKAWLPAHVATVGADADLAVLRLDAEGPFPTVARMAPSAGIARVGRAVAIIGYPLGTDTPMEGSGTRITARSTLVAGTVSKNIPAVLQIDAYAGEGSSGSPVFSTDGAVVGVVYGGAKESGGRIVYAVPSDAVTMLLGGR